jgi:hypothetical protein
MVSLKGIKQQKVAFHFVLVILLVTFRQSLTAEVVSYSSENLANNVTQVWSLNEESNHNNSKGIAEKLVQIRRLVRSLIFDWNFGESHVEGKSLDVIKVIITTWAFSCFNQSERSEIK